MSATSMLPEFGVQPTEQIPVNPFSTFRPQSVAADEVVQQLDTTRVLLEDQSVVETPLKTAEKAAVKPPVFDPLEFRPSMKSSDSTSYEQADFSDALPSIDEMKALMHKLSSRVRQADPSSFSEMKIDALPPSQKVWGDQKYSRIVTLNADGSASYVWRTAETLNSIATDVLKQKHKDDASYEVPRSEIVRVQREIMAANPDIRDFDFVMEGTSINVPSWMIR